MMTDSLDNAPVAGKPPDEALVREIGHANFKQYQIINDPPKAYWWWWLNRVVKAPPPSPPSWMFWKPRPAPEGPDLAAEGPPEAPSDAEATSGGQ